MVDWTRYAVLAAIVVQPVAAHAQDESNSDAPAEAQVVLEADSIHVDEDTNTVIAEGNVEAVYEGRTLRADRLVYNRNTDKVRATGNIIILDPDGTQRFADEIETDNNLSDGYAIGFSTRMPSGGVATAESAIRQENGTNSLEKIVYTSCELCEGDTRPTWTLRARRAVLDQETNMISYRDAVLEVGGVPVVYLPYFAHPDPQSERRSGFLAPDFGTSSKLGLFFQQPYYWAISPSQDLTIAPQVMGNVNPLLEIEYRKRFWSGEISTNFSMTEEQDFDSDGEKFGEKQFRGHFFADGLFNISNNWQWGFGIEQVSDDLYTRRYDIQGENDRRGLYKSQPRELLSQVHIQGQDRNWYADASVLSFEGLRASDVDGAFPKALPVSFAERLFDFGNYGLVGVNASTAVLSRDIGIDSQRASIGSDWSAQRILPGGLLLNPFAEARYDYYELNDAITAEDNIQRSAAVAGARLSYPLFRPGNTVDILIEPTVMAAYGTPGANNPNIPVEDSLFYEADESTLFDANAISGYDLYDGGSKAAIGLSATARWKGGVNISAQAGRRWREDADPAFDIASNLDGTASDWVAAINADFGNPLRLETRMRFDESDYTLNRLDVRARTRWDRLQGSIRYYRLKGNITASGADSEGVEMRGQLKVTDQYYLVYGLQRDIAGILQPNGVRIPGRDINQSIGVAYEDDCSRFEITFARSEAIDRTLGPNDSIQFRFSLKTLGSFGDDELD